MARMNGPHHGIKMASRTSKQGGRTPKTAKGFIINEADPYGPTCKIKVPFPGGTYVEYCGELLPENTLADVVKYAGKLGITLEQAMNRICRDYFNATPCGD